MKPCFPDISLNINGWGRVFHHAMMPMYFKKVLLFPQEQFECHNQNAPAPQKMSHRIKEKCDIFCRSRWHSNNQNAPAPQKMSHRIKEKCDIFCRSRWHSRCGTQIAPSSMSQYPFQGTVSWGHGQGTLPNGGSLLMTHSKKSFITILKGSLLTN